MATIRKRGDKWQVQVRRQGFAPTSASFLQKRDAERWGMSKERELDDLESRGLKGAVKCGLTVGELLARYRASIPPTKRSGSRECYMVTALERAPFASLKADKAGPSQFRDYRDFRLRSVSPTTVVRELGVIHHAYEVARVEWGFEGLRNPINGVPKPKLPCGRSRRLAQGEEAKLLAAAEAGKNPFMRPLIAFALETGMRLGELVAIQWDHVQEAERVILVPITKNDKPRTVALSLKAIEVLQSLKRGQTPNVFPLTASAVGQSWRRLVKRVGLKDLHFHDLRHEAISRLFERGLDMPEVMMMSGHTDYRMLLRYTHLNARKLVIKLDAH